MSTQSWSGKSAGFLMESALTSHGSSKSNKKASDGRGISDYDPTNRFNPVTFSYQARTWISNVICHGLFCVQWVQMKGEYSFCWYFTPCLPAQLRRRDHCLFSVALKCTWGQQCVTSLAVLHVHRDIDIDIDSHALVYFRKISSYWLWLRTLNSNIK